jgi:hypothetical protein
LETSENWAGEVLVFGNCFNSDTVEDVVVELGLLHALDL